MWTRILNRLGIETKAQQRERLHAEFLRQARQATARRRAQQFQAQAVITTKDVPTKKSNKGTVQRPTQQVRQERYGVDNYLNPGFNSFVPDTVFMPAVTIPVPETTTYNDCSTPVSSSYSDSSSSAGYSSDSGSCSGSSDSGGSW